jgi:hypothetical protein
MKNENIYTSANNGKSMSNCGNGTGKLINHSKAPGYTFSSSSSHHHRHPTIPIDVCRKTKKLLSLTRSKLNKTFLLLL